MSFWASLTQAATSAVSALEQIAAPVDEEPPVAADAAAAGASADGSERIDGEEAAPATGWASLVSSVSNLGDAVITGASHAAAAAAAAAAATAAHQKAAAATGDSRGALLSSIQSGWSTLVHSVAAADDEASGPGIEASAATGGSVTDGEGNGEMPASSAADTRLTLAELATPQPRPPASPRFVAAGNGSYDAEGSGSGGGSVTAGVADVVGSGFQHSAAPALPPLADGWAEISLATPPPAMPLAEAVPSAWEAREELGMLQWMQVAGSDRRGVGTPTDGVAAAEPVSVVDGDVGAAAAATGASRATYAVRSDAVAGGGISSRASTTRSGWDDGDSEGDDGPAEPAPALAHASGTADDGAVAAVQQAGSLPSIAAAVAPASREEATAWTDEPLHLDDVAAAAAGAGEQSPAAAGAGEQSDAPAAHSEGADIAPPDALEGVEAPTEPLPSPAAAADAGCSAAAADDSHPEPTSNDSVGDAIAVAAAGDDSGEERDGIVGEAVALAAAAPPHADTAADGITAAVELHATPPHEAAAAHGGEPAATEVTAEVAAAAATRLAEVEAELDAERAKAMRLQGVVSTLEARLVQLEQAAATAMATRATEAAAAAQAAEAAAARRAADAATAARAAAEQAAARMLQQERDRLAAAAQMEATRRAEAEARAADAIARCAASEAGAASALAAARSRAEAAEKAAAAATADVARLHAAVRAKDDDLAAYATAVGANDGALVALQAELAAKTDGLARLQQQLERVQADGRLAMETERRLTAQLTTAANVQEELETLLTKLRSDYAEALMASERAAHATTTATATVTRLERENADLAVVLSKERLRYEALEQKLEAAHGRIAEVEHALDEVSQASSASNTGWQTQFDAVSQALAASEAKLASIAGAEAEVVRLRAEAAARDADLALCRQALDNLQLASDAMARARDEETATLQASLAEARAQLAIVQAEAAQSARAAAATGGAATAATPATAGADGGGSEADELRQRLGAAHTRIATLQHRVAELKAALDDSKRAVFGGGEGGGGGGGASGSSDGDRVIVRQLIVAYLAAQRETGNLLGFGSARARDTLVVLARLLGLSEAEGQRIGLGTAASDAAIGAKAASDGGGGGGGLWGALSSFVSSRVAASPADAAASGEPHTAAAEKAPVGGLTSAFVEFLLAEASEDGDGVGGSGGPEAAPAGAPQPSATAAAAPLPAGTAAAAAVPGAATAGLR